jgi:hypothetical protein
MAMSRASLMLPFLLGASGCLIVEGIGGLSSGGDASIDGGNADAEGPDAPAESGLDSGNPPSADAMDSSPFEGGDVADASGAPVLLAYYAFDDGPGTIAADSSGMKNPGTLMGAASFGPGLRGAGGLVLDGMPGYVSLPALAAGLTSFSVSLWVNIKVGSPPGAHLFDFGVSATTHMYLSAISAADAGSRLRFGITTAGQAGEQDVDAPALPTGQWEHVAVTMGGGTVTLYVNGYAVAQSTTITETPASLGNIAQSWIGQSASATDPYLVGTLDELRVYSGALSAADVLQEARMFPHAWYSFDEGLGVVAHDATGGRNDATLLPGTSWGPGRTPAGAVVLDGKTGYVQLPSSILASATDVTVGGWLNEVAPPTPWERFFDFGSGANAYMYVTPYNVNAHMQFSITTGGRGAEQYVSGAAPAPGAWQHIAVTLIAGTVQLYLSGLPAGASGKVSASPTQLGVDAGTNTTSNRIGRSQYSADPFLQGSVADFCVYTRGLSAAEIAVLAR